jgi:hypothetical protein
MITTPSMLPKNVAQNVVAVFCPDAVDLYRSANADDVQAAEAIGGGCSGCSGTEDRKVHFVQCPQVAAASTYHCAPIQMSE